MTIKQKTMEEKCIITPETKIISPRELLEDRLNGDYDGVVVLEERCFDEIKQLYGKSIFSDEVEMFVRVGEYGAMLEGANLSGRNLGGIIIPKSNLEDANLEDINLENAILHQSSLNSAKLNNANLQKVNLSSSNLWGANLSGTNFKKANCIGATISSVCVTGDTNFEKTNFKCARIGFEIYNKKNQVHNFRGANFDYAQLAIRCIGIDSEGADFRNASFKNTFFSSLSDFGNADLTGTKIYQAKGVDGVNLSKTKGLEGTFIQIADPSGGNRRITYFPDQDIVFGEFPKMSLIKYEGFIKKERKRDIKFCKSIGYSDVNSSMDEKYKPYEDIIEMFKEARGKLKIK